MKCLNIFLCVGCLVLGETLLLGQDSVVDNPDDQRTILNERRALVLANDHIFSITISYEHIFVGKRYCHVTLRAGGGYTAESGDDLGIIWQASTICGKSRHYFDIGIAHYQNLTHLDGWVIPLMGYRYIGKRDLSSKRTAR
jgi:hypothetical protein